MVYAAAVVVLSGLAGAAWLTGVRLPRRWIVRSRRQRILVHTVDDRTLEGVLIDSDRESVVLTAAKYRDRNGSTLMAGDVWLPRARVRFIQTIPDEAR